MGIKEFLTTLFPKFESLIKIDLKNFINIHITNNKSCNSNKPIFIDEKTNSLLININTLSTAQKRQLKKAFKNKEICFIEKKTNTSINKLKKVLKLSENEKLLNFYKNKIPNSDLEILRASFYIKKAFENRDDISYFKNDIYKKYGQRGINITNLYTAGYYDNWIKKIYTTMQGMSNFSKEKFDNIYEKIVLNVFFIIFVSKKMDENNIIAEVEYKLKYGTNIIHIHGIGRKNIDTINKCLVVIRKKYEVKKLNIFEENNIISVELYFN
jgi:hypothetical protein